MPVEINAAPLLELKNVSAGYNHRSVISDISFNISKGEIACLIGPNGSGKSTILKVIAGFIKPAPGNIYYDQLEINDWNIDHRMNAGIGYLIQSGHIFKDLSCEDNIKTALWNYEKDLVKQRINEMLCLFPELSNLWHKRAGFLSGGEKQMLALSIIMARSPNLLLLDEPTASLSPIYKEKLYMKIIDLNKTSKITVLLVEQNVREALNVSNKAYFLRDGRIVGESKEPSRLSTGKIQDFFIGKDIGGNL